MYRGIVEIRVSASDQVNVSEVVDIIATAVKAVDYKLFDDVVIEISRNVTKVGERLSDLVDPPKK
jgi:predicted aconitase